MSGRGIPEYVLRVNASAVLFFVAPGSFLLLSGFVVLVPWPGSVAYGLQLPLPAVAALVLLFGPGCFILFCSFVFSLV
jgi:hypothetical protein